MYFMYKYIIQTYFTFKGNIIIINNNQFLFFIIFNTWKNLASDPSWSVMRLQSKEIIISITRSSMAVYIKCLLQLINFLSCSCVNIVNSSSSLNISFTCSTIYTFVVHRVEQGGLLLDTDFFEEVQISENLQTKSLKKLIVSK